MFLDIARSTSEVYARSVVDLGTPAVSKSASTWNPVAFVPAFDPFRRASTVVTP
jgi:hypothetical protein